MTCVTELEICVKFFNLLVATIDISYFCIIQL